MASARRGEPHDDTAAALLTPFERDVLLSTGRGARVRAAGPGDEIRLRDFYDALGDASSYFRFFGFRPFIPPDELLRATVQDVHGQVTLLVESEGTVIGIGQYHGRPGREEAEVAFAVADAHQQEGVGTLLLEDLALIARAAGYRRLVAETLPGNTAMQAVFRSVGLVHRSWFEDGTVHVHLDLTADDLLQDDADLRDWKAAVRSLRPMMHPAHVVVIGAGRRAGSPGRRILAHLQASFDGRLSVVHPSAGRIRGVAAVRRVDELVPVPDLAVIAVPAPHVADVVADCGEAGVPSAVIVTAGFAELDAQGADRQAEVLAIARRHGMRIVGPNSLGIVSAACGLDTTFIEPRFRPGTIAIAAQSGAVGIAIAAEADRRNAGVSAFVSMGNKADVSGNDLLRWWADDDDTSVVLLYLESFGDPRRFARVARAVAQRKPVVALKAGRSTPVGRDVEPAGALASDHVIVDALFAHTGVLRAATLEELIDVGLLFARQPPPAGSRVALIGNAAGPLLLGTDAALSSGLEVPALSPALAAEIDRLAPGARIRGNSVDVTADATPARLAAVVHAVAASGEVDACVVVSVALDNRMRGLIPGLTAGAVAGVPVAVALIGRHDDPPTRALPTYPTPERAVLAIAIAAQRARWLATIAAEADDAVAPIDDTTVTAMAIARRVVRQHVERGEAPWLGPAGTFDLLDAAGIAVVPWQYATSEDDCAAAAETIGTPCVVKVDVDGLIHKTDEGGVILGVKDPAAAATAFRQLARRFGSRFRGAVVQAQVPPGLELFVDIWGDPAFGPLLVLGAGGLEAELRDDRVVLVAPVSASEAARAVERLRLAPLFHGFRGRPPLPAHRVADVVRRLGLLAAAVPEIRLLDVNPLVVDTAGCVAVDGQIAVSDEPVPLVPMRGLRGPLGS